jgi:hypothetical protein
MDQAIRNRLRSVVTQCRKLLEDAVAQKLQGTFGIYSSGKTGNVQVDDDSRMPSLSDDELVARQEILASFEHIKARGFAPKDALDQLVRETAFTHLNRLCAYKMMEAREVYVGGHKFRESVSRGTNSNGFKFYLADHPQDERLSATGSQDIAYQHFLDWLGGLLSEEIGVLFNPRDPANRLYPPQRVLDQVIDLLNGSDIKPDDLELREAWPSIWSTDETIGWVYQYFTPTELRDAARDPKRGGSQAPRNSHELAFRNQFFTPRYVVEFLADNSLGRLWYEMRHGETRLKAQCRYMVCPQFEVFLSETEGDSEEKSENESDRLQQEVLPLPVRTAYRPKKDPRELRILDPACGSGHFLLYCFDLLETIYEEAYLDPDLGPAIKVDYSSIDAMRRAVPQLIARHNLHGIDIDVRATQIAALSLWLRCQRTYQRLGLKSDRPMVTRSGIVCAEPMPGETGILKEFVGHLEPKLLGQLVGVLFEKMKLAGELGPLLRITEEIEQAVAAAKREWLSETPWIQQHLFEKNEPIPHQYTFDFQGLTDDQFFNEAEAKILDEFRRYAEQAHSGHHLLRSLFAEDAARGFAFVDLSRQRFDVVLMNPPFGLGIKSHYTLMKATYPDGYVDIYSCFLARCSEVCDGRIGVVSSRSILLSKKLTRLRRTLIVPHIELLVDLGQGVMDAATVQSCAYVLDMHKNSPRFTAIDRRQMVDKSIPFSTSAHEEIVYHVKRDVMAGLPQSRLLYALPGRVVRLLRSPDKLGCAVFLARQGMKTFNDFRFLRLRAEVSPHCIGPGSIWEPISKGGPYAIFYSDLPLLVRWNRTGDEIADENKRVNGQTAQARQASIYYRLPGATYSRRSSKDFGVRVLPEGTIIGEKGPAILPRGGFSAEFIIGLLNSRLMNSLVHMQANFKQYDTGILESLPWVRPSDDQIQEVENIVQECVAALQLNAGSDETSPIFCSLPKGSDIADIARKWADLQSTTNSLIDESLSRINALFDSSYGVDSERLGAAVDPSASDPEEERQDSSSGSTEHNEPDEAPANDHLVSIHDTARAVLSLCVGCLFGRWDWTVLSGAGGVSPPPASGSLPPCAPGMLCAADGLPRTETPTDYGLRVAWDGIMVDQVDHADDIVSRVREVLELAWTDRCDYIEKEACGILRLKQLRDYFRRPAGGGFWDDHVKQYSKSRRRAPIYWLLQSSKKNYAIWLYYHRFDKDLVPKGLVNYVEPKVALEENRLDSLRSQKTSLGGSGKERREIDRQIEEQEDLLSELRNFRDKLAQVANLHLEPDLNDGVVLNIAPLWELVPWAEAKKYWDELLKGKYEWSSISKQLRERGLVR